MALYDVTLLQSSLQPVASGLTVSFFKDPVGAMTPTQITSYVGSNTPAASATSDIAGHVQVTLLSGHSYLVVATGYNGAYIAPGSTTAIFATVNAPSSLCKVSGTILATDGSPQSNVVVTANLNASGPVEGSALILASAPSTTSDVNGHWELDLMPNVLIVPKNTLYTFVFTQPLSVAPAYPFFSFGAPEKPHGPSITKVVQVPNVASIDFSALIS
jgi:hypothetical protein